MVYKLNVQNKVKHYPSTEGVIATLSFTNKENNQNIFIFCECYCNEINSQSFGTLKEFKFLTENYFLFLFIMIAKEKIFRIDEVIFRDKKRAFVKWSGYPDQFNSWVPMSELNKLQMS